MHKNSQVSPISRALGDCIHRRLTGAENEGVLKLHNSSYNTFNHPTAERNTMAKMMKAAERALQKRTNKMLASATKRYKKFMRQAAKAASDHKREEYLAAALSALVVTGVVASKLVANLEGKKAAVLVPAKKKRKTKAK
jgi:hypothetical protein